MAYFLGATLYTWIIRSNSSLKKLRACGRQRSELYAKWNSSDWQQQICSAARMQYGVLVQAEQYTLWYAVIAGHWHKRNKLWSDLVKLWQRISLCVFNFLCVCMYMLCWRRGSVVRTSFFGWRTFLDLCLIYLHVITSWVRRPLWLRQPGQLSLQSLLVR